jgi:hypothetical protein
MLSRSEWELPLVDIVLVIIDTIYIKFLFYVLQLYRAFSLGSSYPHGPPLAWRDQQETKVEKCKDALTNC